MKRITSIIFIALFLLTGSRASGQKLVDVGNNFWGGGSFSESNVIFTDIAGDLLSQDISRAFSCSSGAVTKKKGAFSQSDSDPSDTTCGKLFSLGVELDYPGTFEESYDTLRLFMEQCPFYSQNGAHAWDAFSRVGAAVSGWSAGGVGRWTDFLSWLKKVLYLNTDTTWYCSDVGDMFISVQLDPAAQEAAARYVLESGKCPGFTFQSLYNSASIYRHQLWLDSVNGKYDTVLPYGLYTWWVDSMVNKDTLANPYDTTVPSLQQEDLQILLGPQNASVQQSSPITSQALLSAQLLENPMKDEIDISYEMGRTALVTVELRDVLGRAVPIANAKYQLEQPGSHTASIPAPNLPPGVYYLRVTTDVGDAITLKLVKE